MDISKCSGYSCPIRNKCYRFTALASEHQSYINPPGKWVGRKFECDFFLDIKKWRV
jgi:hypothetical protein